MPESDTELLVASVRRAGEIARGFFGGSYKTFRKAGGEPVTEADLAVDAFLKRTLLAARPDYGWLSEESADDRTRLAKASTFIVDPIDGTYGFIKGRPQFTIVAAVVARNRPVAGAIYNPITEEMYEAAAGQGACKNGQSIRTSSQFGLAEAELLAAKHFLEPSHWANPWPEGIRIESRASIAYRMALVAEGAFDAMISLSKKSDWDLAAGDLIVHEAGGCVSDENGATLLYNCESFEQSGIVCSGPALHAPLLEKLQEHLPSISLSKM